MIAMPPFNPAAGHALGPGAEFYASGRDRIQKETFIECPTCGFEPPGRLLPPRGRCPKCHAYCWRRTTRPLLEAPLVA